MYTLWYKVKMRKISVLLENEEGSVLYNSKAIEWIRNDCPEDFIILVSAGDFTAGGQLLSPSCSVRAGEYVKAGADLVLSIPVASALGGYGKKEFASAALVQNLRICDRLMIPCRPLQGQTPDECGNMLRSVAMFMLKEEGDYRSELTENMKTGMTLRQAQVRVISERIPEAKELLAFHENRSALWILDAMLQLYYMAPVTFFQAPAYGASDEKISSDGSATGTVEAAQFDRIIAVRTARLLENATLQSLMDISGSTTQMVQALMDNKERIIAAESLEEILQLLRPAPSDRVRLFLLKAILGLKKIHMQICGLHTYVPYCHVDAINPEKADLAREVQENSWVPFVKEGSQIPKAAQDYYYLIQADNESRIII